MLVASITGHRPQKLGYKFNIQHSDWDWLRIELERVLFDELRVDKLLTGMALGVDQLAADVATRNGIPFVACIPFEGFEARWPDVSKRAYNELLEAADEQIVVTPGPYNPAKFKLRNEFMVDYSERVIAVWNGEYRGGTWSCIRYAQDEGRQIWHIDPETKYSGPLQLGRWDQGG